MKRLLLIAALLSSLSIANCGAEAQTPEELQRIESAVESTGPIDVVCNPAPCVRIATFTTEDGQSNAVVDAYDAIQSIAKAVEATDPIVVQSTQLDEIRELLMDIREEARFSSVLLLVIGVIGTLHILTQKGKQ